jgi:hypothetical protein
MARPRIFANFGYLSLWIVPTNARILQSCEVREKVGIRREEIRAIS